MKKYVLFIFSSLFLGVLLMSCASTKSASEKDSTLVVELESNPTTGYEWICTISNPEIVEINSNTYEAYKTAENIVGSGGVQIFVFDCKSEGTSDIEFVYKRPWNHEKEEIGDIQKAKITVDKSLNGSIKFF